MLDSFDVMLYALVLASMMARPRAVEAHRRLARLDRARSPPRSAASSFGVIADRFGRTRALMASVLIYSFVHRRLRLRADPCTQLAICRVVLGIGMGGEWASGAALVSETWPKEHRGKALGLMQSAWAIGYAAAAIVTWLVLPIWRLARRVLRRRAARAPHAVGAPPRRGARDLARADSSAAHGRRARPHGRRVRRRAAAAFTIALMR